MENFTAYNPTKVIFGKNAIAKLGREATQWGRRALILIGKGSVKHNGVLAAVEAQLAAAGIAHTLFEGIKSNPVYQDADAAVAAARSFEADMLIAVGGGSVLDTAKAVAAGYYVDHSVWQFFDRSAAKPSQALPLLTVLTLAATGSEMNCFTVLQNDEAKAKIGYGSPLMYPKASFLDPEYTYSVSPAYTAYGVADLISHCLEAFFDSSFSPLSDANAAEIIRLAMHYGRMAVAHPQDYEARAQVMWLATVALNGSLDAGKRGGDWGVHSLEHSLSALFDIPHGAGLAIVYPAWLKHFSPQISNKLDFLATRIVGQGAKGTDFIQSLEQFFVQIGAPVRLAQANIGEEHHQSILDNWTRTQASGQFFKLSPTDYEGILANMSAQSY